MATTRHNRLALDENHPAQAKKDVGTGKSPGFTLATPYVLSVARVVDDAVVSISDWTSARLQVTDPCNKSGDRYLDRTTTTLNAGLTQAQWDAGTAAHASFAFTGTDMNLALAACDDGPLYFVVTATRQDGQVVTLGTGTLNVERAYQTGTNLVLAKAGDAFPQLALTGTVSEGAIGLAVLPGLDGLPNHFHLAFTLPAPSLPLSNGIDGGVPTSVYSNVFDGGTP